MKAKFQIENVQELLPSLRSSCVFSQRGGLIGSSEDSTWRIQDSAGAVPEVAARILVADGRFTIERVSNAKIRINKAQSTIPRGRPVILSDKDLVQIEGLHCSVSVGRNDYAETPSPGVLTMVGAESGVQDGLVLDGVYTESRPVEAKRLSGDGSDPLDAFDEKIAKRAAVDPIQVFADYERRRESESENLLRQGMSSQDRRPTEQSVADEADMHFAAMPNVKVRRDRYGFEEQVNGSTPEPAEPEIDPVSVDLSHPVDHVALRPLARSLGIHLGEMSVEEANRVLADIGASLRAALEGLNRIYHARRADSGNFPLATMHLHALEDNPIRFSEDTDEALHAFFSKRGPVHLSAPAAMQETLDHLIAHQSSTEKGIDRALDSVLAALGPKALERRFKAYDAAGVPDSEEAYDAWCWRMYRAYFSELRSQRQQGLQMLFWEVFGNEYHSTMRQEQMRRDLGDDEEGNIKQ
ncbi:type VI secretion system-associated FHA domain protein TagH [Aestuariispira ectoiniformans]|uniref:type VI secretion system-associated FHA domain protein TagH n=1 Tax=Aestuariispira ectoiniformans TaxID=2775080 RepID=UPI00223C1299|nr:type VI secretion system-associated FHA domain protein TagH [Aestuariispira ectoiniformans]